jgi:FKBP-type peptidyl-prolyl cis-trans isomerase SlyD
MIVEKNKVVTFTFELSFENSEGVTIQQVEKSKPMVVIIGKGALLEPFEQKLTGLKNGDIFTFTLLSDEAFGPYKEKAIAEFEKSVFTEEGQLDDADLVMGNFIPMETEDGIPFNGKILKMDEKIVTIDFNHPLAGKDLMFKGEILEVRDATQEELSTGIADKMLKG